MAFLQVSFVSRSLFRAVPMNVILPTDKIFRSGQEEQKPFKTLYLLHGLLGNHTDYVNNTRIQQWAEAKNLCVVMPAGDNSFYVDNTTSAYGEFIGKELVEATRRMFPLSHKREDTFIAGLSMGGFGAIRNGLKYHENFGYIAGMSNAVHLFEEPLDKPGRNVANEDAWFGNMEVARHTDKNPRVALENLVAAKKADPSIELPKVYLCCGTEDGLIGPNRIFRDLFKENGFDITYEEGPGVHNWDYWNQQLPKILDWLPLDNAVAGINSGNVGGDK